MAGKTIKNQLTLIK